MNEQTAVGLFGLIPHRVTKTTRRQKTV